MAALLVLAPPAAGAGGEGEADDETLDLGRTVFLESAEPNCGVCHTLAEAGAAGKVGPNLDNLEPSESQVRAAVKGGVGAMPAFDGQLSAEEIEAVSRYVAEVAGKAD
ncbi:MAG: c-type cytochrome [Dichotomicrobium sp.]